MRAGVDAVLLDVDDTVVDTRGAFRAAMDVAARAYLPHLGDDGPRLALEHWVRDGEGHFAAFTRGELTFEGQRRRRLHAMHDALGGPDVDDALLERWNACYEKAFRATWEPVAGARALLQALAGAGVPFGAVTNSVASYQSRKLAATGLDALRVLVGTDTLGVGKPDPRVFRHGCALLGSAPSRTVYVGDEPAVDAAGATAAGLVGVWLDRFGDGLRPDTGRRRPPSGVPVVRSLGELAGWLELAV